ncbi:UNVERIFIED_CONTAM: hypothetical protein GTU68_012550 [Idotea baltica]|nr:hypothetical protein [Idotea baltica]
MNQHLPIQDVIPEIKAGLAKAATLILQAPPGAGKSTVLPLELMDEPWLEGQKIIMLEPRRLAARSVAHRMAQLIGQKVGDRIGYRVRFDTKIGPKTQVEVVTEGILTRMMQSDNALEGIGMVIFDEFHERSLQADLGLVMCRQIQEVLREDLRILIMSATLDLDTLQRLFPEAPLVQSEGRQFPITYHHLPGPGQKSPVPAVVGAIRQALNDQEGDILTFLPGAGEIRRTAEALNSIVNENTHVFPLFGDLPPAQQEAAILPSPAGQRKIVLATSIAETSLTIEGIKTVVDAGLARVPRFDPGSGMTRLETVEVTRDAADQRAGRAGRLGPGVCYRLWEKGKHQYLTAHRSPEILHSDLASAVLELAQWGINDIHSLDWPSPPPIASVSQAITLLTGLQALENGKITSWGKKLLKFPSHPRLAHLLIRGTNLGHGGLAADIAAVLDERDPLGWDAGADVCRRLDALRDFRLRRMGPGDKKVLSRIERVSKVWRQKLKVNAQNSDPEAHLVGRLIAEAYPERIARKMDADSGRYRLFNSRAAFLKVEDPLSDYQWIAAATVDATLNKGRIFLGAPLDPFDLKGRFHSVETVEWKEGALVAQVEERLGTLVVRHQKLKQVPKPRKASVVMNAVQQTPKLLPWDDGASQWQARVMSLRAWRPEEGWPEVSTSTLMEKGSQWLQPYLGEINKAEDLAKLRLVDLLNPLLPWELNQELKKLAPTHFTVPSGSNIRIEYYIDGRPPVLAVRLQEVFGLHDTPAVNQGRNNVMVHLLSPARRPVQVTQDLRSFWETTYSEVRKELRGRYLKHYWPEDPFTAEATRGVKRKKKR